MSLHNPISPLHAYYVQKVLPAVYDDSLSYYEILCKVQETLNEVVSTTNEQSVVVLEMQQAINDFIHGGYTDSFEEYLDEWFEDNSDEFVQRLIDEGIIPEVEELQSDIGTMHASIAALEAVDTELTAKKVPYPLVGATPSYGTSGQVLATNADGTTDWQDPVIPSDAQAEQVITQWLNDHPEATTTVQDGAISTAKLANGAVTNAKLADGAVTLAKLGNDVGITDLKNDLIENYVQIEAIKNNTVAFVDNAEITATQTETGAVWRLLNGQWQKLTTGTAQYWTINEYPVNECTYYNISGARADYTPVCIYIDGNGNFINCTEIVDVDGNYERQTDITVFTPKGTASVIVQQFTGVSPFCRTVIITNILKNSVKGYMTVGYGSLVAVNLSTKTITFPADTVVNINGTNYNVQGEEKSVSYEGLSSAIKVGYDTSNNQFVVKSYNQAFNTTTALIFTARTGTTAFYPDPYFAFSVNGDVLGFPDYSVPYKLPIKWRHGVIAANGETYANTRPCITDFIIPTNLVDYVDVFDTSYEVRICYYEEQNGRPVFIGRSNDINTKTNIDKTHEYFAVSIFKNWTDVIDIEECNNIVGLYTSITPNAEGIIQKCVRYTPTININDVWSICHQGYNSVDLLGKNRRGAYALCALRGFTHGECDIKLTSDNKVVCCHDATFEDATTGETITIRSLTLAELQECDYYGTTIATLGEIISECKKYGIKLCIDQWSIDNVGYACQVLNEFNAWDICTLLVQYRTDYPNLASTIINTIKTNYNENAHIAVLCSSFTNYSSALSLAKTLNNGILDIGQYDSSKFDTLKTIASQTEGLCKLMIWTVDNLTLIQNALPYIDGFTSNVWSGNDIFNPTINNGL